MISLHVYPLSYIFAEKLEAIVYRGDTNSRMKDFYDVLRISDLVEFDLIGTGPIVHAVFRHRKTTFMNKLYYDDEARKELTKSWGRFLTALDEEHRRNVPSSFADVVVRIDELLGGIGMAG